MPVELVKSGRKPSDLITKEVLLNAIMFDMAVAGSTNAVLHILTMAYELGLDITLEDFEKYAKRNSVYQCGYSKRSVYGSRLPLCRGSSKRIKNA